MDNVSSIFPFCIYFLSMLTFGMDSQTEGTASPLIGYSQLIFLTQKALPLETWKRLHGDDKL